jgi:hypothetical protein
MAESSLVFRLLGIDAGASRAIAGVGRAAEVTGRQTATAAERSAAAWGKVGKAFNVVGKASAAIMVGLAYEGVKAATNFEQAMARVHTQAGASNDEVKALSGQILTLSPKVGVGPEQLADSLYHVESAGFRASKAMDLVAASAKLSQIGGADIEQSTQAIIGVMASGIKGVKDANDAVALLNTTVGTGDMKMSQLVKAIGTDILPTAKAVGLSFEDVGAALATITDNATPADQVATRLKTSLLTLIKPSNQQSDAFNEIHMSALQVANDFQKPDGLLVAVRDLKSHLEAAYPASQSTKLSLEQITADTQSYYKGLIEQGANVKDATKMSQDYAKSLQNGGTAAVLAANTLARALGGSKTAGIFLTLIGETDRLASKYDAFGDSTSRAAKLQEAWAKQQDTAKQKLADLKAAWDVFLVRVGNAILPDLKSVVSVLAQHPGIIKGAAVAVGILGSAWAALKIGTLIQNLGRVAAAILGMGTASATAATEVAALGGAQGLGAVEREAGAASGAVGRFGNTFASRGLLLGGAAVVGLAGIAGAIHEIMDDSIKGLPYLDKVAEAIGKGGVGGAAAKAAIDSAMGTAPTGNERKESIADYIKRTTSSPQASAFASVPALNPVNGVTNVGASYANLDKIIQKGDRQNLEQFIANYDKLQRQLNASPETISTVDNYLTALFNRFNSGRDAVDKVTTSEHKYLQALHDQAVDQQKAGTAASANSTNALQLAKVYGISSAAAKKLAFDNGLYADNLSTVGGMMAEFNKTLVGNTQSAQINRRTIGAAAESVKSHALEVFKDTGSMSAANAVFAAGIGTIESNAAAVGANKQEVINYIAKVLGIPPSRVTQFLTPGLDNADSSVASYLQALNAIPQNIITTVTTMYGSAFPTSPNDPRITGHKAAGGLITGPGTGISDSIPTMLSNGEFVMTAKATSANLPLLQALNSGGGVPGGGDIHVHMTVQTLDSKSFTDNLRGGWAKDIKVEIDRAQRYGLRLN